MRTLNGFLPLVVLLVAGSVGGAQVPTAWFDRAAVPQNVCKDEGWPCTFDNECCQSVCKNHQVCEAPLFCVPAHAACAADIDCCDGVCDTRAHECADKK